MTVASITENLLKVPADTESTSTNIIQGVKNQQGREARQNRIRVKVLKVKAAARAENKRLKDEAKKQAEEEAKKKAEENMKIRTGEKAGLAALSFFERKQAERLAKKQAQQNK